MSQEFRLKNINETWSYFLEEIQQMNWLAESTKRFVIRSLNYIEHFLILASIIIGCISIYAFTSLFDIPIGITSSSIGLKICATAAEIKKYNSVTQEVNKRLNHPSDLATRQFIEDFSLFIKQCYHIVWSVEKYRK